MKHILDKDFKYKPSYDTDISKRFEKVRDALKSELELAEKLAAESARNVKPLIRGKVNGR